ncbi:hypothetical protein ACLFKT_04015, partial [Paraburkholderia sp. BR14261]
AVESLSRYEKWEPLQTIIAVFRQWYAPILMLRRFLLLPKYSSKMAERLRMPRACPFFSVSRHREARC